METAGLGPGDPDRIGPYRAIGVLGEGGMGKVYLAEAPGLHLVAVKMIRRELAGKRAVRERFAREIEVARGVSGLYTAQVLAADTEGPDPWLATAYIDAPSLERRVLETGPLPYPEVRKLTRSLAAVLKEIHASGVVHRDLKPSNILLASDGLRLIDFGIARQVEPGHTLTHHGVLGTAGYMSPEQAWRRPVGPASDIFSLGVVICCAATGTWPWGTGDEEVILLRAATADPDLSGLPEDLRDIASRCLRREPKERPSAAKILEELSREPGSAPPPPTEPIEPIEPLPRPPGPAPDPPVPTPPDKTGDARLPEEPIPEPLTPEQPGREDGGSKARWVIAIITALILVIASGIFAAVELSSQPLSSTAALTPTATPTSIPGPHGCPVQLTGPDSNEPIGIVKSSCFAGSAGMSTTDKGTEGEMKEVASQIEGQNNLIGKSPYRTVVFFGVMSKTSGAVNPASLYQLRGTLYQQMCQNGQIAHCASGQSTSKFKMRVLLANPGSDFEDGQSVAQEIINCAKKDPHIVAVIGIGQSWTNSQAAIEMLKGANLPVIGTAVTGDQFSSSTLSNFFRISPDDTREAQLAASFAKNKRYARVIILANLNVNHGNQDLYSGELAQQFTDDFTDSSHSVIETCDYGDVEPVEVSCGGQSLTLSGLRERICQDNSDLIFFAARAVTLPDLLNVGGVTCKLPAVLGSSDVPKYIGNPDLKNASAFYYLSFAPAKESYCSTPAAHPYQTPAECAFITYYRGHYKHDAPPTNDPDNSPILSFDSSDAMLGDDALETVVMAIDKAGGSPGTNGADILRELGSGKISFPGVSGLISFPAGQRTSFDHPIYVTSLGQNSQGQNSLAVQISCGQYSTGVPPGNDPGCPASPY